MGAKAIKLGSVKLALSHLTKKRLLNIGCLLHWNTRLKEIKIVAVEM